MFTTILSSILSGLSLGGVIVFWLRKQINLSFGKKVERSQNEIDKMNKFLEVWFTRRLDYSEEWHKAFAQATKDMVLWCPDSVLYHLGEYLRLFGKKEGEAHFGEAVLSFRKTLGYKNRSWRRKKLSADHIVLMYSASNPHAVR